ncbi:hypothetical protein CA233_00745 [Sphingomonas sp. ABOLD]|uniref:Uncharacterized protein n=2 Tax=Sphingomonas trueperi TaxID=53317 RepID=A0A7X6BDB9_9SPHN|nr:MULTISPECIES: hypothetical protein [unclassified Sphingomonas]NJB97741.1 hypothetical protein [Sphingomonas trueperi]RSV43458.1 hypothetical protein CA234_04430 [Sphingomonas sp. ABOLE]RSV52935.1 hypothetical protein CA233_00745 [Sphingomonas sp. ABOLD]
MKSDTVRHYLMMSLEFGAYCVLMTLLSYLMVLLVLRAPQPNSGIYIGVALLAALLTGLHAGKMFRMYRIAMLRFQNRKPTGKKKQSLPVRHWSDRIAAEEAVGRHDARRKQATGEEASPELEAIRLRIAERMAKEDRERDELAREDRERLERERIERMERARSERIRNETRASRQKN